MLSQRVVNLITKEYQFRVEVDRTSLPNAKRHFQLSDANYYDLVVSITLGLYGVPHALPIKVEVVGSPTTMLNDACGFLSKVWKYCDPSAKAYIERNWQVKDPWNNRPEIFPN